MGTTITRETVDGGRERRLLTALIMSTRFVGQAAAVLGDLDLVESELFLTVAKWCLKHFRKHGKAPKKHVEDYYHRWSENADKNLAKPVKDLLGSLSDEYARKGDLNVPFMIDELRKWMAELKIARLKDDVDAAVRRGDVEAAEGAVAAYRRVDIGEQCGVDPLDGKVWDRAFADPPKPLIEFEGDAGYFFNHALTRDALVGVQAPEKRGKTYWCNEFVVRALMGRRRVAYFQCGDLSEGQLLRRFGVRWSGCPLRREQCGSIAVPREVRFDESEESGYRLKVRMEDAPHPLTKTRAKRGARAFFRAAGIARSAYLRLSFHATGTASVSTIQSVLEQWKQEHDFVADVIVVDYADILAPETESLRSQPRDQSNETWKALRRLSQERHALVITPTQAKASTYHNDPERLQSMRDFGEDKRKFAHCTAMLALNQVDEEKESGGMRLNWVVVREAPFQVNRPLYVGTCFSLGRALCCASLRDTSKGRD